ncbi:MAG: RNA pseudouridine synthase [Candidatus Nitrohelix vancouverensis]|uniref:RNA pseudouridine synthase n=1 Tax=Candidatus Nitrohelix vancouverensis TaxID=2705534 RepID=A0A7T0G3G9_9BACT|nr:MAG: RNA pseudouridine synthase [Candidatus Nitrohelix vancouverensis]
MTPLNILYIDNHLLAVEKPAGLLIQGDRSGEPSLLDLSRDWLRREFNKPGEVFLGLLHRLDRQVPGVVLFARTSKAASRLSQQFRDHTIKKFYCAVAEGIVEPEQATLVHYLRKERSLKATVFPNPAPEAKRSELDYRVIESLEGNASVLEIALKTGRFHQIRAQLSFSGHPLLGDSKYRAQWSLPKGGIALYASRLEFSHPIDKKEILVQAPEPKGWPFWDQREKIRK